MIKNILLFHKKQRAINAISRLVNLQELNLDVRNISANKSFQLFSNGKLKNLKILRLGQYGNGFNKRVLYTIANECPNLEHLDITDEKNILFPVLPKFCNLKKLSVIIHDAEICNCENEKFFEKIAESCKFLETIKFQFRFIEEDIKVSAISKFCSLKLNKLQLMSEFGYFYKEDFLELFTKYSWGHLTNLHISSRGLQMKNLLKGISENCPNLENLRINGITNDLNESNVLYLIKNCKSLQSLGSLNHKYFSLEFLLEIRQRIANIYLSELEGPITPLTSPFHIRKLFFHREKDIQKIYDCEKCNRQYHYLWALPSDDTGDYYPIFDYPRTRRNL